MTTENRLIDLTAITLDQRLQPRAALDAETVEDYAARYRADEPMPDVTLYFDGETYWLADGFHRVAAAEQAGLTAIGADVRSGTFRDALLFAAGANAGHGLRRSNADKRRAIEMLMSDPECAGWSDSEIARHCSVDHKTVATVRTCIMGNSQDGDGDEPSIFPDPVQLPPTRTVTRNGVTYKMHVGNIGRRPEKPCSRGAPVNGLLSCPFCGGNAQLTYGEAEGHVAICRDIACNVIGPRCQSEDKAREGWNRRA